MIYRFSPRAQREVDRVETWWRENRPAAPSAFVDELAAMVEQLETAPESGAPYGTRKGMLVRRLLLPTTRHQVYYVVEADFIDIISVRSTWRKAGPRFGGAGPP